MQDKPHKDPLAFKSEVEDMKDILILIVGILVSMFCGAATVLFLTGCSGSIHAENDLFQPSVQNSDRFYTNGLKFSYFPKQEKDNEKETYSIGQNIYTPSRKYVKDDLVKEILDKDRPYAGWLYGEYRKSTQRNATTTQTFGIQIGCSGPCSGARQTQQEFHRIIGQSVPLWSPAYTLRQEWGAILEAERTYILQKGKYYDVQTYSALKAGNIIDSGAVGITLRSGYGLDTFQSEPIIFKLPRKPDPWHGWFFVGAEQRAVLYNHFLEGSLFHAERHTVTTEPFVQEFDAGFTVGFRQFRLTYRYTIFSNEWKERPGSFTFGGLDFSW